MLVRLDRFVMIDGDVYSIPDYDLAMEALAEPTAVARIRQAKKLTA